MADHETFIEMKSSNGVTRKIAYDVTSGTSPIGVFWMSGFLSTMKSQKISAVADWCHMKNYTFTRFDYSGRGRSDGLIEEGSISQWLDETKAVFLEKTRGPQILVGSSMGGWMALLFIAALAKIPPGGKNRIVGLILMAPAWNLTQLWWDNFTPDIREQIEATGIHHHPSPYGAYAVTRHLIEDGRRHLIRPEAITPQCPIIILHGMRDPVIPWQRSLDLTERIGHDDVVLKLIKDADHRLSRDKDLARLAHALEEMMNTGAALL